MTLGFRRGHADDLPDTRRPDRVVEFSLNKIIGQPEQVGMYSFINDFVQFRIRRAEFACVGRSI